MPICSRALLLLALAVVLPPLHAAELTGRFAMLGVTGLAQAGDVGYQPAGGNALAADQQSARLMLDELQADGDWSVHLRTVRSHLDGYAASGLHSSELFRYRRGAGSWLDEQGEGRSTTVGYELDRALYRHRFDHLAVGLGRQPIDWGSGRLWQPLNVFGAFAPTDLDTDFKPGIDALAVEAYPGAFATLTAVYAFAPQASPELKDSGALHYRRQVGSGSELALVGGTIVGNRVVGAAFESAVGGMGWRVEGAHYTLEESGEQALFWIAGSDYQFRDGTLLTVEWYDNSRGASREAELGALVEDPLVLYRLQPQLARQAVGLSLARTLTPLLQGGYTLLGSALRDSEGARHPSLLHQLHLTYSVGNESDLQLSYLHGSGKGLNALDEPQSEFGHLPRAVTLRLRFYF